MPGIESSPLNIDEAFDMGDSGGLVSRCLFDFETLLKALTRGIGLPLPVRSIEFCPAGNVVVALPLPGTVAAVGKYGKLLLFGITNASSPVGKRDGINCTPPI